MINLSHFRYATTKVGFGAAGTSAATAASNNTAKISSAMATAVSGASSSSPFESASQNNISGSATLAAQAAIARVKADATAKSKEITDKIDAAQNSLNDAKSTTNGPMVVGYTVIQKYVSWVYTPPAATTDTTT
jgi:hypothetical protein